MRSSRLVLFGSVIFMAASPAMAQAAGAQAAGSNDGSKNCETGTGQGTSDQQGKNKDGSHNLSSKLAACGGVLKPPVVGDQIAKPAPKTGNTRVIKPGQLPGQQSPNGQKDKSD